MGREEGDLFVLCLGAFCPSLGGLDLLSENGESLGGGDKAAVNIDTTGRKTAVTNLLDLVL